METYAKVLTYAIPGFVILIIIEYFASILMNRPVNRALDTISSLSSGMSNTLKDILGIAITIISYTWMYDHISIFSIASPLWLYILAFILTDFASYWSHRFNHEYNVLWNRHIVHHSSEEFNLSCALRQSISGIIGIYFFLYIPMAIIGIPPKIVAITAPLHLFAQFWYHTRLINKMGWLEYVLMTPSHHRVHHAINPEYIDKNYSAIFVIWDKMFGTFQPEIDEIPPVYGVKRQVKTWNPFIINYQHFWLLIQDAWRTKSWWDKIRIWMMPTGWRPADVINNYPVAVVSDVYKMEKYDQDYSSGIKAWFWLQLIVHNLLLYFILANISEYSAVAIIEYSLFIVISIFAYTSLMDRSILGIVCEVIRFGFGLYLFSSYGGWFGIDQIIPNGSIIMMAYLVTSVIISCYIYFNTRTEVSLAQNTSMA